MCCHRLMRNGAAALCRQVAMQMLAHVLGPAARVRSEMDGLVRPVGVHRWLLARGRSKGLRPR